MKKFDPSTFIVTYPTTVTSVSAASDSAAAIVIVLDTSFAESILNLAPLLPHDNPAIILTTSPATSSVGNPVGSVVLESHLTSNSVVPINTTISKLPYESTEDDLNSTLSSNTILAFKLSSSLVD